MRAIAVSVRACRSILSITLGFVFSTLKNIVCCVLYPDLMNDVDMNAVNAPNMVIVRIKIKFFFTIFMQSSKYIYRYVILNTSKGQIYQRIRLLIFLSRNMCICNPFKRLLKLPYFDN